MYANKRAGRRSTDETVHQVLLRVAAEHDGDLPEHVNDVADMVDGGRPRARALRRASCSRSAAPPPCTTSARSRSPTRSCTPRARSNADEWEYIASTRSSASGSSPRRPSCAASARSCGQATNARTAAATRTASAGEQIPLGARIVAVCDAYDAMVTDRAYRARRPPQEALEELLRCAGAQFDPDRRGRVQRGHGKRFRVSGMRGGA